MNKIESNFCQILWPPEGLWACKQKMEEIKRYFMPDGSTVPYANEIEDNDWRHTLDCVLLAYTLKNQFPELGEVFDFEIIIPLLWIHEADEICGRPDRAICLNEDNDHNNSIGAKKYTDLERIKITNFIESSGLETPGIWLQRLEEMENPEAGENLTLLFAKLIDWFQASLLIANFGNFENEKNKLKAKESFEKTSGWLFKKILNLLNAKFPKNAGIVIINNLLYFLDYSFQKKGLDLEVKRFIPDF